MSAYYLIINDAEFTELNNRLVEYWTALDEHLARYEEILKDITDNGLVAGNRHDMMVLYLDTVSRLRKVISETAPKAGLMVKDFLQAIETADTYLYDAKYGVHRFYDERAFYELNQYVDKPWSAVTDAMGGYFWKKIYKIAEKTGWEAAEKFLHESYAILLDYMNTTKQEMISVFDGVHDVDREYGYNIGDDGLGGYMQVSHLGSVALVMYEVESMLEAMREMIGSTDNSWSPDAARNRLNSLWAELDDYRKDVQKVPIRSVKPTPQKILNYSKKETVKKVVNRATTDINTFMGSEAPADWEIYLAQMFEVFKDKMKSVWHGEGLDPKSYQDYVLYMRMMETLEIIESQSGIDGMVREEDIRDIFEDSSLPDALKLISKYGKKAKDMIGEPTLKDLADIMTDDALDFEGKVKKAGSLIESDKKLKKLLKGVDGARMILKYGEKGLVLFARYTASYDRSMEILDSFERSAGKDQDMQERIGKLRDLYNKKAIAWLKEVGNIAGEEAADASFKVLEDSFPLFKTIKKTLEVATDVTGLKTKTQNAMVVYEYSMLLAESKRAYEKAAEALDNTSPDSPDFEKRAEDVYNCFIYHKQNMLSVYDAMAGATTGVKSSYYRYCRLQISRMNMTDDQDPYIMSFEEFSALNHETVDWKK